MLDSLPQGATRVRIEKLSADATTAVAIVIYDELGVLVTLGSTQRLFINQLTLNTDTAMLLQLADDIDADGVIDAGEMIDGGYFAANGGIATTYPTAKGCKTGSTPKIKASVAGNVRCTGAGYIL